MKKIYHYFNFRLKQFFRIFNLIPNIGFSVLLCLILLFNINFKVSDYFLLLFAILIFVYQLSRKDISFLKKVFVTNWRFVVFLENLILYAIILMVTNNYRIDIKTTFVIPVLCLLTFVDPIKKTSKILKLNFIPSYLFEIKSLIRQRLLLVILSFVLSLISGFHTFTLFLFSFLSISCVSAAFQHFESNEIFISFFTKYDLDFKIYKNILAFNLFLLPTYLMFLFFNYKEIAILLYYIFYINVWAVLLITRKYKTYTYKEKNNIYNISDVFIDLILSLAVFPALLVIKINTKNANQNIATYVTNT